MSRIGNRPVRISGLSVKVEGNTLFIGKEKDQVELRINDGLRIDIADEYLKVVSLDNTIRQYQGLFRTLVDNAIIGFQSGFSIELDLVGVGYKVEKQGDKLVFNLGYSHPVEYLLPKGLECTIEKLPKSIQQYQTTLKIRGSNKEVIGQVAADLVSLRKPDVYKGKGIRYADRLMLLKPGKSGAKGSKK
ncbi:MAG: 50S ribosomal protein L6 [Acidobacteriota bacterium]